MRPTCRRNLPARAESANFSLVHMDFQAVKVIALAATDIPRARQFYSETLGLEEDTTSTDETGYRLGEQLLIFRDGYPPSDDPNPRLTLRVQNAQEIEQQLKDRSVTISNPVELYKGKFWVGAFLDSEGNKLWFCSYA